MSPTRAWLLLAFCLFGCVKIEYLSTDVSFRPRGHARPLVFIDRLPPYPYRSVGIFEATVPVGSSLAEVLSAVVDKGAEIGCEAIVDRAIHRVSAAPVVRPRRLLVQFPQITPSPVYVPAQPVYATPPPGTREFICAVREEVPAPPAATILPPAPAPTTPEKTAF
jgi:hypothetical protein